VFVCNILFPLFFNVCFFLNALTKDVFFDWVSLSSHGTLVSGYFVGLYEHTISRYFHSFIDLNDISNEHKILMDLH
jgi:hypothetical protein